MTGDEQTRKVLDQFFSNMFERARFIRDSAELRGRVVQRLRLTQQRADRLHPIDLIEYTQEREHEERIVNSIRDRLRKRLPQILDDDLVGSGHERRFVMTDR